MKPSGLIVLLLAGLVLTSGNGIGAETKTPAAGDPLPDLTLPAPKAAADLKYLGLSGGKTFKVPQIKADVVVLEIFSMYCPYCQKEAPSVNALYERIEKDPALRGRIKLLGIGAGNSPFEVDLFKKKYAVPFPLVPDGDFAIHQRLGEPRTPLFIAVRIGPDGTGRVVHAQVGAFAGVDAYLNQVLQAAGL